MHSAGRAEKILGRARSSDGLSRRGTSRIIRPTETIIIIISTSSLWNVSKPFFFYFSFACSSSVFSSSIPHLLLIFAEPRHRCHDVDEKESLSYPSPKNRASSAAVRAVQSKRNISVELFLFSVCLCGFDHLRFLPSNNIRYRLC